MLPINQVSHGQWRPSRLAVEPAAAVVQAYFGRQACLHPTQDMGPLVFQAEAFQQPIMHGLDDLAQGRQPPPQRFRPAMRTPLLWLGHDQRALALEPAATHLPTGKALVGDIAAIQWVPNRWQAWEGLTSSGQ